MARRSQHSFLKRQKEIKRKDKAAEKTARRQGKIERPREPEEIQEQPEQTDGESEHALAGEGTIPDPSSIS
jgi:hypothetical protein